MCPPARIEDNQEVDDSDDDEAAAEDAEHFVTRCRAAPLVQLRLGLIDRLRLAASEWEEAADLKEGADGVDADHPTFKPWRRASVSRTRKDLFSLVGTGAATGGLYPTD